MSTPLTMPVDPVAKPAAAQSAPRAGLPNWTREPLLHFLVLGALLFGADHLLISRSDDPHTIVVGAAVDKEAIEIFKASRNRDPNAEELAALRKVWLDNEVLYREGLALQVDRGDSAIRDRVIFKALSVVDANTKLPPADDATLQKWFESHRAKYDEPARFDFQEAALDGDSSEAAVRAFVTELNAGTPGDAKAGLRVFKGRPHQNLVLSYGEDFAKALETAPVGEWRAEKTREGWRAVRLEAVSPAKPAQFEVLRPVVQQDWTDATLSEQRSAAVQLLAKKYNIRYEDAK
ncbi:peptidyl-prolyl cis-trans isomerase [Ideonella azotifigens]|uniref:PpiC domain-containing protein n=2 Tax=Ideonella azotifigens TaxID=513160 RepID=A0ABP3VNS0_9BURK|nr:peptidylprolyl isomerase [Ideonella azotifigens]MCD2338727.1 peptidyl-prolyl cis-trans isomerase [Ideonella azotifigens]